eukprot:TRINITY_DN39212_c0_g1_i1.p1 TRINITY_DN39212_c0_g1~~TRINITY_DN39212_c0_g1_i1.p1  ORF type:complete len:563 (+),score=143.48 TRINITY_DN39212_c0_g1_i1:98-1690(+)
MNVQLAEKLGVRTAFLSRPSVVKHLNPGAEVRFGKKAARSFFSKELVMLKQDYEADPSAIQRDLQQDAPDLKKLAVLFRAAGEKGLTSDALDSLTTRIAASDVLPPTGSASPTPHHCVAAFSEGSYTTAPGTAITPSDNGYTVNTPPAGKCVTPAALDARFTHAVVSGVLPEVEGEGGGTHYICVPIRGASGELLEGVVLEPPADGISGAHRLHLRGVEVASEGAVLREMDEVHGIKSHVASAGLALGEAKTHLRAVLSVAERPSDRREVAGLIAETIAAFSVLSRAVGESEDGLPTNSRAAIANWVSLGVLQRVVAFRSSLEWGGGGGVDCGAPSALPALQHFPLEGHSLADRICQNFADSFGEVMAKTNPDSPLSRITLLANMMLQLRGGVDSPKLHLDVVGKRVVDHGARLSGVTRHALQRQSDIGLDPKVLWDQGISLDAGVLVGAYTEMQLLSNMEVDLSETAPEALGTLQGWRVLLGMRLIERHAADHISRGTLAPPKYQALEKAIDDVSADLLHDASHMIEAM